MSNTSANDRILSQALKYRALLKWHRIGSSYVCDPPVTQTDTDYLVLVPDAPAYVDYLVKDCGFTVSPTDSLSCAPFHSCRNGTLNIVATGSADYYRKAVSATASAKRLNLTRKEDRVSLTTSVLEDALKIQQHIFRVSPRVIKSLENVICCAEHWFPDHVPGQETIGFEHDLAVAKDLLYLIKNAAVGAQH